MIIVSTGTAVPKEVAEDPRNAFTRGENAYITFKAERLETDPPVKKFKSMKKNNLKTFGSAAKKYHKNVQMGDQLS